LLRMRTPQGSVRPLTLRYARFLAGPKAARPRKLARLTTQVISLYFEPRSDVLMEEEAFGTLSTNRVKLSGTMRRALICRFLVRNALSEEQARSAEQSPAMKFWGGRTGRRPIGLFQRHRSPGRWSGRPTDPPPRSPNIPIPVPATSRHRSTCRRYAHVASATGVSREVNLSVGNGRQQAVESGLRPS
jgi:hypothetical protein